MYRSSTGMASRVSMPRKSSSPATEEARSDAPPGLGLWAAASSAWAFYHTHLVLLRRQAHGPGAQLERAVAVYAHDLGVHAHAQELHGVALHGRARWVLDLLRHGRTLCKALLGLIEAPQQLWCGPRFVPSGLTASVVYSASACGQSLRKRPLPVSRAEAIYALCVAFCLDLRLVQPELQLHALSWPTPCGWPLPRELLFGPARGRAPGPGAPPRAWL